MNSRLLLRLVSAAGIAVAVCVCLGVLEVRLSPGFAQSNPGDFYLHWSSSAAAACAAIMIIAQIAFIRRKRRPYGIVAIVSCTVVAAWLVFWIFLAPGGGLLYHNLLGLLCLALSAVVLVAASIVTAKHVAMLVENTHHPRNQMRMLLLAGASVAFASIVIFYVAHGNFYRMWGHQAAGNRQVRNRQYARALYSYTKAQRYASGREMPSVLRAQKGYVLMMLGRFDEAIEDLNWAIDNNPYSKSTSPPLREEKGVLAGWYFLRAQAAVWAGQSSDAESDLAKVLEMTRASDEVHQQAEAFLDKIGSGPERQ